MSSRAYHVPAETRPHLRTLLAWPDKTSDPEAVGFLRSGDLKLARQEITSIANAIARFEPVWLYAKAANVDGARAAVSDKVTVKAFDYDQLWIRDTGPIFVSKDDGSLAAVDTNFNFWGGKFDLPNGFDLSVARRVLESEGIARVEAKFVSEGGALEFDGEGTLLATESSILNPNRNPGKSRSELEAEFRMLFGVEKTIWLEGAAGIDSTDFHVDALARFGPNDTILLSRPNKAVPRNDIQYKLYLQAKGVLANATNAAGRAFKIIEIEEGYTVPRYEKALSDGDADETDGELPCLSYVNFYLANGAVIVPVFGDKRTDPQALEILRDVWSDREVVPVKLNWMAFAGGGVHCATQQWPSITKET